MPIPKNIMSYEENMVWVLKKSDVQPIDEKGDIIKINPKELFNPVYNKHGVIIEGDLFNIPQSFKVELIDKDRLKQRTRIWVKKGEEEPYTGEIDFEKFTKKKTDKYGSVVEGTLPDGSVLQYIQKNTLRMRGEKKFSRVWVIANTEETYEKAFNPRDLINPTMKENEIVAGSLRIGDSVIHLEYISKTTQRDRSQYVWVKKGTSKIYTDFDIKQLKDAIEKDGVIVAETLPGSEPLELEYIQKHTQKTREKRENQGRVWINAATSEAYTTSFNPADLKNKKFDKQGLLIEGILKTETGQLRLKNVTENAKYQRDLKKQTAGNVWLNAETAELYVGEVDIDKLKNKKTSKKGKITGILETEEGPIKLIYTTKSAQRYRVARLAKATQSSTSTPVAEAEGSTTPVSRPNKRQKVNEQNEVAPPSFEEQVRAELTNPQSILDETLTNPFTTESMTESEMLELTQLELLTQSLVEEDANKTPKPLSQFFEDQQKKRKEPSSSDEENSSTQQKRRSGSPG